MNPLLLWCISNYMRLEWKGGLILNTLNPPSDLERRKEFLWSSHITSVILEQVTGESTGFGSVIGTVEQPSLINLYYAFLPVV